MSQENVSKTGCCEPFDPASWDGREITWNDRLFLKDKVRCLFHIPLNFGKVMVGNMGKIKAVGAMQDPPLVLADDVSPWRTDVYISVASQVGPQTVAISGTFLAKVFEGPYRDCGKWRKEMAAFVASRGKATRKLYTYYTTCPNCQKAYGKNYVVLLAQV